MKKLYNEERDTDGYDNLVMKHMMAMTIEGLHSKAAIAIELAYRDKRIAHLERALRDIKEWTDRYTAPGHPISTCAAKALEQTK